MDNTNRYLEKIAKSLETKKDSPPSRLKFNGSEAAVVGLGAGALGTLFAQSMRFRPRKEYKPIRSIQGPNVLDHNPKKGPSLDQIKNDIPYLKKGKNGVYKPALLTPRAAKWGKIGLGVGALIGAAAGEADYRRALKK